MMCSSRLLSFCADAILDLFAVLGIEYIYRREVNYT